MTARLDQIDLAILAELQADGRMTNVELARRVGISAPPCLRRVRALEEAGVISGYRALIDARALGMSVVFFVFVHLEQQTESEIAAFSARVATWKTVREGQTRALGALAGTALLGGGSFRKEDIRTAMANSDTIRRCEELIAQLVASDLLIEMPSEDSVIYRFVEDSIAPYLWLLSTHIGDGKTLDVASDPDLVQSVPVEQTVRS